MLRRRVGKRQNGLRPLLEALESRELLSAALPGFNLKRPFQYRSLTANLPSYTIPTPSRTYMPLPSTTPAPQYTARSTLALPTDVVATHFATSPGGLWYTPAQMRRAYGMDQISFGSVVGDGTGQTIALVVGYHYPTALADLNAFSQFFNLPTLAAYTPGIATPYFRQVAQDGSQNFTTSTNTAINGVTWQMEAAMDVQWAHAMAPGANIVLVEANSSSIFDLISGATEWARNLAGVSAISMSFGVGEFSGVNIYDFNLVTPPGHNGITFIASTGDFGSPAQYPATSSNVVGVGGTSLTVDASGNYLGETGWSGSGGGISTQISKPSYQSKVTQSATMRTAPDLALDSDPNTGVAVYDSFDFPGSPWFQIGGTSLAAPMFAGMVAVADQGRSLLGLGTLDGPTGTLPKLYAAPASDFHDVTSGNNGVYSAGPGYDLVTGLGTPVGNALVNDLIGVGSISGRAYADYNGNNVFDAGDVAQGGIPIYLDANGNGVLDVGGTQTVSSGTINQVIPDLNNTGTTSSLTMSGLASTISNISVNLNITHTRDSNLAVTLIGPDNTSVVLFSGIGGNGANFTNTTLLDSATTSISSGVAAFAGNFKPVSALATFNGKSANGIWKLKVVDSVHNNTGSLNSWSITITTATEKSVLTAADGTYSFNPVLAGTYAVREVIPTGFGQVAPANANFNITGATTGVDLINAPNTFAAAGTSNSFYLWQSQGKVNVGSVAGVPLVQYAAVTVPALKFNLSAGSVLTLDFSGGSPVPAQGMVVNGGGTADSQILLLGGGSTLTMTDTQVGVVGGGVVSYSGLGVMTLRNSVVNYHGTLSTLGNLLVDVGTVFYWS